MRASRFAISISVASATLVFPAVAAAQSAPATGSNLPGIDATTWHPSTDPRASMVLEPVATPGPWQWNVGAWLSYAHAPVVLRDASGQVALQPLSHVVGADLVASLGLGTRLAVGVDVPVFVFQDGTSDLPSTVAATGRVPSSGLGDLALLAKANLVPNDHRGIVLGFGLSAVAAITLPTGDTESFQGAGSATESLRLLGEYALGVGAVRASVGYMLRTGEQTWPDASAGGVTFGDAIPWSLGVALRPKAFAPSLDGEDRQTWEVALHGALPASPVTPFVGTGAAALSPAMVALDDRVDVGHYHDTFVLVGVDVGLDQAVGVPAFRGVVGLGWAPRAHDRDGDGVPDEHDECPDLAEDQDGIQDGDG